MTELKQIGELDINCYQQGKRVYSPSGLSPNICTCGGGNQEPKMRTEYGIRKLTPKECWRLMGFSDEDFIKAQSTGISDRQLYKQAGNSIVVDVLYYIFKKLFDRNETITVNELFSGIGAQRNALQRLGQPHKVVGIAEIDKYAIQAYNAIYGDTRNYGDISKAQRLDYADLWTYSFPCFTGDTLVLTDKGYTNIKDIQVGDKVLTHRNTYEEVTIVKCNGTRHIYSISAAPFDELNTTSNHRFYVRTKTTKPKWKECGSLTTDDFLGYAINQNNIVPDFKGLSHIMNNESFWWLIGRYIANDRLIKHSGNRFYSEGDDINSCLSSLELGESVVVNRRGKYHIERYVVNKDLALFVKQLRYKGKSKKIPAFVFDMPVNLCEALLDGYVSKKRYTYSSMTADNRELAYGLGQLIAKTYKRPFSICKRKSPWRAIVDGKIFQTHDEYIIELGDDESKAFYDDGCIWFPVEQVTDTEQYETVYDITVDKAHSFTANGVIAHNCTDISICGQLQGMIQGETRSGLLYEVQRLLERAEQRPKYLLLENVKNLVSKRFKPQFDEWCRFLGSMGYNTYWQILSAKNYGIPQNRERVFAVSIRKDIDNGTFRFPEPVDSGLCCDDLLDGRVDEKYFYHTPKATELMNELIENPAAEQGTLFAETADEELRQSILSRYHISDKPIQSVNCMGGSSMH